MKAALALVMLPAAALAEPARSVNVNPLGALAGDVALTYEQLFAGRHGLVVEGSATRLPDDADGVHELGGAVGYRWHWRRRQNSGFVGVMVAHRTEAGFAVRDEMTYPLHLRTTSLTVNLGKRWMIGGHVNVTLRVGAGWGRFAVRALDDSPDAQRAAAEEGAYLRFLPLAFDGELSAGVVF